MGQILGYLDYLLGFVILLGVLIFIHEFGHFIVAKACRVRVETFSIGMGKKFLRFRRGETEYALSLLPLGGYVKLLGQDPREEVPPELADRSFREKALWQRAAIVLAGPFFNAALAVAVFVGLYQVGIPAQAPVLVRVLPNSPAAAAGFRSGDRVSAVEGGPEGEVRIRELADLERAIGEAADQPLTFRVERALGGSPDAGVERVQVAFTPILGPERDSSTGIIKTRGTIPGVEYAEPGPVLSVNESSWAAQRQVPNLFWVEEVIFPSNGIEQSLKVESFADLERTWRKAAGALARTEQGKITLKGRRVILAPEGTKAPQTPPEEQSFNLAWTSAREAIPASLEAAGIFSAELSITDVKPNSPADKLGLKAGDRITALNGQAVHGFQSFRTLLQKEAGAHHELKMSWVRAGKSMESTVRPELVDARDPFTEAKKSQFQIGAMFLPIQAPPPEVVVKGESLSDTVRLGFSKTVKLTASMLESFYLLAKGEISPKTLGGPILIGKIAGESFKAGPVPFLKMLAFISMNLCILNLLPIPVLDGGHLILYCIEAVRRRPLNLKVVEMWTTAGFFFLMGLIAVVFFNDINRLAGIFK